MKRSVNFSHIRKKRNPYKDIAKCMQYIGFEKEEIIESIKNITPTAPDPNPRAGKVDDEPKPGSGGLF